METPVLPQASLHLDEVWKQRSESDQLSRLATFIHHSKLAVVFLIKSSLTSALSILSVATVLFILGLLVAVQSASFFGMNSSAGSLQMSVFVRDRSSDADKESLSNLISTLPGLNSHRRLDKAAALEELKKIFSEDPNLFNGLEIDNPLPASFELNFDLAQGEDLPKYAQVLKQQPAVESVAYDGQLFKVLSDIADKLKGPGRISLIVLIGLTLFLIATTIRISLYHESDEIEIMGLVGAYHSFIQAPFIIGGAIQGLLGFLIAYLALCLAENKILGSLRSEQVLQSAKIDFTLLGTQSLLSLMVLGIGAGIVGSYFASKRIR